MARTHKLGSIFGHNTEPQEPPFSVKIKAEGLTLEQYIAQRQAGIQSLEERIKVYIEIVKLLKRRRTDKEVIGVFEEDMSHMKLGINSLHNEIKGVKTKLEAIYGIIFEDDMPSFGRSMKMLERRIQGKSNDTILIGGSDNVL